jgi:hypothetical protein
MLFWPTVAVVGFVVSAAVVVLLARSSTTQYEFERNQVERQRQQAEVLAGVGAAATSGAPMPAVTGGSSTVPEAAVPAELAGLTAPPSDEGLNGRSAAAWWLVAEGADQAGEQVVAGPFPDRIEAEWAGLASSGQAVYGVRRADGQVVRRQLPEDRAWLSDLSDQLDRLPAEWDHDFADDDELVTLVVEVASALVESGLQLHDCVGEETAGGVCLSPEPGRPGIVVSWHQHQRASFERVREGSVRTAVHETMVLALAECLLQLGYAVEPFGSEGRSLLVLGSR